MFNKIEELGTVHRGTPGLTDFEKPVFFQLPEDAESIYIKIPDEQSGDSRKWVLHMQPSICYDDNGIGYLMSFKSQKEDIVYGFSRKTSKDKAGKNKSKSES